MPQSQSNRIEALESRVLFSAASAAQDPAVAALRGLERVESAPASKLDEWPLQVPGVMRSGRTLYIRGTDNADTIGIGRVSAANPPPRQIRVTFNYEAVAGQPLQPYQLVPLLEAKGFRRILINGLGGNDSITIAPDLPRAFKPRVIVIRGGVGNDNILGGSGNDYILGEAGIDTLNGRAGKDTIDGGDGNDTLTGGSGPDVLIGREGNDTFNNGEGALERGIGLLSPRDYLYPGPGTDVAVSDPADIIRDDTA